MVTHFFPNMTKGVTPQSHQIYHIHMLSFYICLGIFTVVTVILIVLLWKYRKSKHVQPQIVHSNLSIEILWIIVPFILLIIMGTPATLFLINHRPEKNPQLNILITGYQWQWQYNYLDQHIEFFSRLSTPLDQIHGKSAKNPWYLREVDRPLVLPINTKIRFLVTSHDVVHSWWVPALGIKRDAIPGFIYESSAIIKHPGIYRGQCAELCGVNHGFMPIVVLAVNTQDFEKWVSAQRAQNNSSHFNTNNSLNLSTLITEGKQIYVSQCSVCHQLNGNGMPPTFPALQGSKVTIGPVARHIDIVINGQPKTAMPAFGLRLNDEQIAAVITYERNSWGNNNQLKYGWQAGGIVLPEEIHQAKNFREDNGNH